MADLHKLLSGLTQPRPNVTPLGAIAQPTSPDPYAEAVQKAMQLYPWIKNLGVPIKLTKGTGPYMSESYDPKSEDNPNPGTFTIQLRSPRLTEHQDRWAAAIGREGMDYMARNDPIFQGYAKSFRGMMTRPQLDRARIRYNRDMPNGYHGQGQSPQDFEDFLKGAEVQEYLGGYVFNMKGWEDAGWTPHQKQLLEGLKKYMWRGQTPTSVNVP